MIKIAMYTCIWPAVYIICEHAHLIFLCVPERSFVVGHKVTLNNNFVK